MHEEPPLRRGGLSDKLFDSDSQTQNSEISTPDKDISSFKKKSNGRYLKGGKLDCQRPRQAANDWNLMNTVGYTCRHKSNCLRLNSFLAVRLIHRIPWPGDITTATTPSLVQCSCIPIRPFLKLPNLCRPSKFILSQNWNHGKKKQFCWSTLSNTGHSSAKPAYPARMLTKERQHSNTQICSRKNPEACTESLLWAEEAFRESFCIPRLSLLAPGFAHVEEAFSRRIST